MRSLAAVLDAIARVLLGEMGDDEVQLGSVILHAHQRDALRRVRASVERTGGALLADEPGLGKTFVALALARESSPAIVLAPAALRAMWREAAITAGVKIELVSLETLSRRDVHIEGRGGLVIVDEAHHVCNPATARYARLARLVSNRRVLFLSATPVRNRRSELGALLALFMGPRAHTLDDAARSQCIVRRRGDASLLPAIDGPHWHLVESVPGLASMIERLPPPLPAFDGREARALLTMTLARCWASSLAALDAALRRRLQRGAALEALLDAGRVPTRDELRAWVVSDDAVQLAFPILAAHETPDAVRLSVILHDHLSAVHKLRERIAPHIAGDSMGRARLLLALRESHRGARLVAFTAHAATAEALYRALSNETGIALLTSRTARTAGGPRPRADVIDALARNSRSASAAHNDRDTISLVVTTDLLSEGVNLQGASVIVHLDIPWTPAGLDQRVGRAARMGSAHTCVRVHGFAPPAAAQRLLRLERLLVRKHAERVEAARAPEMMERLRALIAKWRANPAVHIGKALVATAFARRAGFIAVVENRGDRFLVCGEPRGARRWKVSDAPGALYELAQGVRARAAMPDPEFESQARCALARWLRDRLAWSATGAADPSSRERRALLARVDSVVARARSHTRAAVASRAMKVRALIEQAIGAGAERTLAALARADSADVEAWLAACESLLATDVTPRTPLNGAPAAVRALLLLRLPTTNCSSVR